MIVFDGRSRIGIIRVQWLVVGECVAIIFKKGDVR